MARIALFTLSAIGLMIASSGCASAQGDNPMAKKQHISSLRDKVLYDMGREHPEVSAKVGNSPGYGVFSNINFNLVWASAGSGYGVVVNNRTGKKTYMKMALGGVGLGLGVKSFRQLIIFRSERVLDDFVRYGWEFGGHADAAAIAGYRGGALNAAGDMSADIEMYQITDTGLTLQATVSAAKYWQDSELNGAYIASRN